MQLITLSTDWGYTDHYIGAVKARLYSTIENCQVIDITHNINKFDYSAAGFVISNSCLNFPKGTIHIIDVDCMDDSGKQHILVEWNEQYFICTDNGIPYLVFSEFEDYKIYGLEVLYDSNYYTFTALNFFCQVALDLSMKRPIEEISFPLKDFENKYKRFKPILNIGYLSCTVFYVDSYGNAFLNIKCNEFLEKVGNKTFSLEIDKTKINKLSFSYKDVQENRPLLTVSSTGYLQIAISKGNAAQLLSLDIGTSVKFEIRDK